MFENATPEAEIKLIDFSLGKKNTHSVILQTDVGSPAYVVPEVLKDLWHPMRRLVAWRAALRFAVRPYAICGDQKEVLAEIKRAQVSFDNPVWNSVTDPAK